MGHNLQLEKQQPKKLPVQYSAQSIAPLVILSPSSAGLSAQDVLQPGINRLQLPSFPQLLSFPTRPAAGELGMP